jgi:hypothetical protein
MACRMGRAYFCRAPSGWLTTMCCKDVIPRHASYSRGWWRWQTTSGCSRRNTIRPASICSATFRRPSRTSRSSILRTISLVLADPLRTDRRRDVTSVRPVISMMLLLTSLYTQRYSPAVLNAVVGFSRMARRSGLIRAKYLRRADHRQNSMVINGSMCDRAHQRRS